MTGNGHVVVSFPHLWVWAEWENPPTSHGSQQVPASQVGRTLGPTEGRTLGGQVQCCDWGLVGLWHIVQMFLKVSHPLTLEQAHAERERGATC